MARKFKTSDFKDMVVPPMYIMQLILFRYNNEEIHWIAYSAGLGSVDNHFSINLKHILSSLL